MVTFTCRRLLPRDTSAQIWVNLMLWSSCDTFTLLIYEICSHENHGEGSKLRRFVIKLIDEYLLLICPFYMQRRLIQNEAPQRGGFSQVPFGGRQIL